jgi:ferritin
LKKLLYKKGFMMKKTFETALNEQFGHELASAHIYLAMSAYLEDQNLRGCAKWMRAQAQEEYGHAMKFYTFIVERDGSVIVPKIDAPKANWKSAHAVFAAALAHEQGITKRIDTLMNAAVTNKDYASQQFLGWFVTEQVEEENTVKDILSTLDRIGTNAMGLIMLDKELGGR